MQERGNSEGRFTLEGSEIPLNEAHVHCIVLCDLSTRRFPGWLGFDYYNIIEGSAGTLTSGMRAVISLPT